VVVIDFVASAFRVRAMPFPKKANDKLTGSRPKARGPVERNVEYKFYSIFKVWLCISTKDNG
jgi:hypothetical protein